jgi:putative ABC transport system permease protein
MLLESIRMSLVNIIRNKLRSFLTMLGIVIGVASIIALISLVQGATESISSEVIKLGGNKIFITIFGTPLKQGLSQSDVEQIEMLDNISGISPTIRGSTAVVYKNNVLENVLVEGKNEVYFNADPDKLLAGRPVNILDIRGKSRVAVVGSNIVKKLFFGENPIGKEIIINGTTFFIVGTLKATTGFSMNSTNDTIIIPYTTALRNLGVKSISSLDVYLDDTNLADDTVINIKGVLNQAFNYNEDSYNIYNMGDIIKSFQSIMSMMSLLLAGIAAISLVVGGIGIMNMMLVSVTERTTEIGLRKALGAAPFAIQLQFLIESVFLSLIGGITGLFAGVLLARILAALIGVTVSIDFSTLLLSIGFSAAVGIIFGFVPARKASKLNPIDALRSL